MELNYETPNCICVTDFFPNGHVNLNALFHCGLVNPYGGVDLGQHWHK